MESILAKAGLLLNPQQTAGVGGDGGVGGGGGGGFSMIQELSPDGSIAPPAASSAHQTLPPGLEGKSHEQIQQEQMMVLQYLMELDELREKDPSAFKKAMKELGISTDSNAGASAISPEQKQGLNDKEELGLKSLIEQLKAVTTGGETGAEGGEAKLHIPGNANKPPPVPGLHITPIPGFSIKTVRPSDGSKVFINVCTHEEIAEPQMKKKLNEDGEEVEGLNIPMSVGPSHPCKDKSGAFCIAYDVIVSPKVMESSKEDETGRYKDFLCRLSIQSIEGKSKEALDQRYKIPKGLKYMGNGDEIETQMIQDRKKMPKIEEVKSTASATKPKAKQKPIAEVLQEPEGLMQVELFWETEEGAGDGGDGREEEGVVSGSSSRMPIAVTMGPEALGPDRFAEYLEPLLEPPRSFSSIIALAEIELTTDQVVKKEGFDIKVSPFKASIKIPHHKEATLFFPCAVDPNKVVCTFSKLEGSVRRHQLALRLGIDRAPWELGADAGSKNWLVSAAMRGEGDNPYLDAAEVIAKETSGSSSLSAAAPGEEDELPEDRFQLRMPKNVNKYTGLPEAEEEEQIPEGPLHTQLVKERDEASEFPEDRFHKKDATSQYIINQREQAIRDKWAKHEKEKAERGDDPNVEYIDVDDFKPGGKYGPPSKEPGVVAGGATAVGGGGDDQGAALLRAADVVKEGVTGALGDAKSSRVGAGTNVAGLKSSLWTELLD